MNYWNDEKPRSRQPSDFALYCLDIFENCGVLGPCTIRHMMGGWIISIDSYTFAIVCDLGQGEELWLKANNETKKEFEKLNCSKFTYFITFKGKQVQRSLNYYSAPIECLDSPEGMKPFAELAFFAALTAKKAIKKKK